MVDKKVSQETAASSIADADTFRGVQGGFSVRFSFAQVKTWIQTTILSALSSSSGTSVTARVATTGNINLANALENGDTIDGVVLSTGQTVLVWQQTAPAENGLYAVSASGAAARVTGFGGFDTLCGLLVTVREGSLYADKSFLGTANTGGTIEVTAVTFVDQTVPAGTTVVPGILQLATTGEGDAYTNSTKAITPEILGRTAKTYLATVADDAVYLIPVPTNAYAGWLIIVSNIDQTGGIVHVNNVGGDFTRAMGTLGTLIALTTGALTGTTGANGFVTISIFDSNIYVENRLGGSVQFTVTVSGK